MSNVAGLVDDGETYGDDVEDSHCVLFAKRERMVVVRRKEEGGTAFRSKYTESAAPAVMRHHFQTRLSLSEISSSRGRLFPYTHFVLPGRSEDELRRVANGRENVPHGCAYGSSCQLTKAR